MLRFFFRLLVLCSLALPASLAHAVLLYDNGAITDGASDGRCDSGRHEHSPIVGR